MNFNKQFEDDLYVAKLSHNLSMPDDNDDEQDDNNIEETQVEETQVEENVRIRGRGRGKGRGKGKGVSRDVKKRDEQNVELLPSPFFNTFQHSKPLHKFTAILPNEHQLPPSSYSIFCLFFFT
ncbi:hypothetical protein RclHR1_10640008 [Rhizophagus clarus]|uniref:Uncharacterized protein n=1 Tax=Rhizophagus clarus TaxID=94130 RepID=A0A2Z6QE55_9GLOM|nr:hypothetical protein RclHR1_10640008 [Rhizophagus clarus]GES89796.1 hypothetical protein RCL_jg12644.t1 [Rhizophagus clarus]